MYFVTLRKALCDGYSRYSIPDSAVFSPMADSAILIVHHTKYRYFCVHLYNWRLFAWPYLLRLVPCVWLLFSWTCMAISCCACMALMSWMRLQSDVAIPANLPRHPKTASTAWILSSTFPRSTFLRWWWTSMTTTLTLRSESFTFVCAVFSQCALSCVLQDSFCSKMYFSSNTAWPLWSILCCAR